MRNFIIKNKRELIISAIISATFLILICGLYFFGLDAFDLQIIGSIFINFFLALELITLPVIITAEIFSFIPLLGIFLTITLSWLEFTLISFGLIKFFKFLQKSNLILKSIFVFILLFGIIYLTGALFTYNSETPTNGGLKSCLQNYYSAERKYIDERNCILDNRGFNPDSFKKIVPYCENAPNDLILITKSDSVFGYEVVRKDGENVRLRSLPINVTVSDYCFMVIAEDSLEHEYQLGRLQRELGTNNKSILSVPIRFCQELGRSTNSPLKEQACYQYLLGISQFDTYVINADEKLKQSFYFEKWQAGLKELCEKIVEPKPTRCSDGSYYK